MVFAEHASLEEKLRILSDAAKYDVACTSSGVDRAGIRGSIGNTAASGICHTFSGDGRCISLLKILFTNECIYNCKYCINRVSNDVPRATFTPAEVCELTMEFYRRNYIEGLFLSSGIIDTPDYTMELIGQTLHDLRTLYRFNGYIHCKAIPGASPELVELVGWYADRMSINMELPTAEGLRQLAPNKNRKTILTPMRQIQSGMEESRQLLGMKGGNQSAYWHTSKRMGRKQPGLSGKQSGRLQALRGEEAVRTMKEQSLRGSSVPAPENMPSWEQSVPMHETTAVSAQTASVPENVASQQFSASAAGSKTYQPASASSAGNRMSQQISAPAAEWANSLEKSALVSESAESLETSVTESGRTTSLSQWRRHDTSRGFVPAGQSTQMIIGATGESDYEIMSVSEALYQNFDLKRVFYSAFINVNQDTSLPAPDGKPPLLREHRLYQADFLLRYYGFETEELLSEKHPNFNVFLDPKCDWALAHMEQFPVEINTAAYNTLLRVPGIGVKSASRIIKARLSGSLDFFALKKIGVVLKRALYFITCNGKMMYDFLKVEEDFITRRIVGEEKEVMEHFDQQGIQYKQMSLFDDFHVG